MKAFEYACNQWAGLQFEPFIHIDAQQKTTWNASAPVNKVCARLVNIRLKPFAQLVFNVFAKVEVR